MRFLRADLLYPVSSDPITNGIIITDDSGKIHEIRTNSEGIPEDKIEVFEGSICPGFVNTHCHLELSHLKGKIPQGNGLVQFAKDVIKLRGIADPEMISAAMADAENEMQKNGIVAVGDISNTSVSFAQKAHRNLQYHTFIELIGLNPSNAERILHTGHELVAEAEKLTIPASIAPHAPYSTSRQIMEAAALFSFKNKLPSSIHNQESEAENEFFRNKSGAYLDLYSHLNLPLDHFTASGESSLQSYIESMKMAHRLLLVHNTFSSEEDMRMAQETIPQLYWCLCPAANLYIERNLPDLLLMQKNGCKLTIGTDSLASNSQLSIAAEMGILKKHFPNVKTEELIKWATINGAEFLGLENEIGSLEKGKVPGLVLLDEKNFKVKRLI